MSRALAEWLRDPALRPVWDCARHRLERNGVTPAGTVTVAGLDRDSRHAVSGLLGRPVLRDGVRVDLGALDAVLRDRSGLGGLVAVLDALGGPVRNRVAERSARDGAREAPYDAARAWLAGRPEVASAPWVEQWLVAVRRAGVLSRVGHPSVAAAAMVRALQVTAVLVGGGEPKVVARNQLAAEATGDAHALDDGGVVGRLVLRALAAAAGEQSPATSAGRRALWERHGVSADRVSSTCLVLGLRPMGTSGWARRLALAADAGDPVHVTAWDLARSGLAVRPGTWVLVCENPRVVEAVAEARGGSVCVVCTSGMPGLVTWDLLHRLAGGGAELACHGDFDWPGIAIANRLVAGPGCRPWRMTAAGYRAAARADGPPLEGSPVTPSWDPALRAAMSERQVGVHEEAVLDDLLDALR